MIRIDRTTQHRVQLAKAESTDFKRYILPTQSNPYTTQNERTVSARPGLPRHASACPGVPRHTPAYPGIPWPAPACPGMPRRAPACPCVPRRAPACPGMGKNTRKKAKVKMIYFDEWRYSFTKPHHLFFCGEKKHKPRAQISTGIPCSNVARSQPLRRRKKTQAPRSIFNGDPPAVTLHEANELSIF